MIRTHEDKLSSLIQIAECNPESAIDQQRVAAFILDLDEAEPVSEDLSEKASHFIELALRLEPNNARFHWTKGYLLQRKSDRIRREAIGCFKNAVDLEPENRKNHFQYISAHRGSGRLAQVVEHYLGALRNEPENVNNFIFLAFSYHMARQFSEAIATADQGLRLSSHEPYLLYIRGESLVSQDRVNEAMADYQKCLEIEPQFIDCHFSMAAIFERQQRYEDASNEWRQIITKCEAMGDVNEAVLDGFRRRLSDVECHML